MNKLLALLLVAAVTVGGGVCQTADASELTFSTLAGLAGSVINSADGSGSAAQFYSPRGVAADSAGNVFVADSSNNTIRKVTAAGVVTTFAGTAGVQGHTDGTGASARFIDPYGLAVDSSGNIFVADTSNNMIRKITPAGVVTTLAGSNGQGSTDGTGTAASFREPRGIAVDSSGNIYVADYGNDVIRKVTAAGVVTTFAGTAGSKGSTDGTGSAALFKGPIGVSVDSAGTVYVADTSNSTIRKITSSGVVTTLAGSALSSGTTDGSGSAARFSEPRGITVGSGGTLYVADYSAHNIRKITAAGVVTTLAGGALVPGTADATGTAARFYYPSGVSVDSADNVYVADTSSSTLRKITSTGVVTTLAGLSGRSSSVDGSGTAAVFEDPYAVAADGSGNVYVADATDHSIRKITAAGVVTTLAGTAGSFGSIDGTGAAARFFGPQGIAADSTGTVYVADTGNNTIRKITTAGVVSTFAGTAGSDGNTDGTGSAARFSSPNGIVIDNVGNLYVVDTANNTLRKITPAGVVTTLAGSPGLIGLIDGTGSAARFTVPLDVAADSSGNLYVSDHGNHAIRQVTAAGVVTTLAGTGSAGSTDGIGTAASFRWPTGIAVDSSGTVYVADTDNHVIRQITSAGVVTTAGGAMRLAGSADGVATAARFFNPKDVAVDGSGNLYVADRGNHTIRKGSTATALSCSYTLSPTSQAASAGGLAGNISVTAVTGCSWTASSNDSWISVSSGSSGSGNGNVVYGFAANTGASNRSGSMTIAGQTFAVTQAGSAGACASALSPSSSYISSSSGTGSVTVTAASSCAWSAASNASWLGVTSATSGTGNGTVAYSVTANSGTASRSGTLTVGGMTLTVTQNGTGGDSYVAQVQTMYIAYFGRPADPGGLAYYSNLMYARGGSYAAILDDFANSAESLALYNQPTVAAKLDQVYTFLFGRVADPAGSAYWNNLISSRQILLSNAAYIIAYNAQSADAVILASKKSVATTFTAHVDTATEIQAYANSIASGRTWLAPVMGNATAATALANLDATIAAWTAAGLSPPTHVAVTNLNQQTVGSSTFSSSAQLTATWTSPSGYAVDHYLISATEAVGSTSLSFSATASATSATLTGLKAGTDYGVAVTACADVACIQTGAASAVAGRTSEEYWQLQGSGNSVSTLTRPVSDGNARLSATRFGAEAGATANTVQFYYGPLGITGQAVASSVVVSSSNAASYLTGFTSYASTSGLRSPTSATSGISSIMTGQGVPLSAAMGSKVRLFIDSNDADGKNRIYSVDSVDGYVGRDFNSGSATTCSAAADYLSSGNCPATVVIGVEGDATRPTSRISAARQNKIAWPTLTDWRWDGAVGTFMVFTVDAISGCTTATHNHAYAVWDGTNFVPQFDSAGCLKMFKSAQAALPMHIGDVRYKMYFGDPAVTTGRITGSSLPFVGPKKLIYADGRTSGNTSIVDYEDWEGVDNARNVNFLWPNGDQLNDAAEGYIDDFHFLTPTGSIEIQVLYLTITNGSVIPFSATAVLLNP